MSVAKRRGDIFVKADKMGLKRRFCVMIKGY